MPTHAASTAALSTTSASMTSTCGLLVCCLRLARRPTTKRSARWLPMNPAPPVTRSNSSPPPRWFYPYFPPPCKMPPCSQSKANASHCEPSSKAKNKQCNRHVAQDGLERGDVRLFDVGISWASIDPFRNAAKNKVNQSVRDRQQVPKRQ